MAALRDMFDFQRFSGNEKLCSMIRRAEEHSGSRLSIDDLDFVNEEKQGYAVKLCTLLSWSKRIKYRKKNCTPAVFIRINDRGTRLTSL